jgi:hypothetical protein
VPVEAPFPNPIGGGWVMNLRTAGSLIMLNGENLVLAVQVYQFFFLVFTTRYSNPFEISRFEL